MKIKTIERGWAGHFICAHRCRYRRNTHVTDGKKYIVVSSVGLKENPLKSPRNPDKFETIGAERYYETMIFHGYKEGSYIEANVSRQISIPEAYEWGIFGKSEKDIPENSDNKMDEIHNKLVDWAICNFKKLTKNPKQETG